MQSWLWTSERAVSWRLPRVVPSLQRQLFDRILPASPRTNRSAQQNRSGARSLRTCWLCTYRCKLARIRLCVGCNNACNLHSSLGSQSGERTAHSILSLAGQRANSNFPGQSNCMQSPTTRPSLSRHPVLHSVKAAHCHTSTCLDGNCFTLNSCICSERGTWGFVLQKGPYAVLTC